MGCRHRISTLIRLSLVVLCLLSTTKVEGLLTLGDDAPPFLLYDQEGFTHSLIQHRGQFLLLFFYPKDFSSQSIKITKAFEKVHRELNSQHVLVYGVSKDVQKTHAKFHEKFDLSFDLLADPDGKTISKYEAKGLLGTKSIAYLIGPDGRIFRKYESSSPMNIPDLVLQDLSLIDKLPIMQASLTPEIDKAIPKKRSFRSYFELLVEPIN